MADDLLRELAPLLAEEGIDPSGEDPPDLPTLQAALNRAVERRNPELFSPLGATGQIAVETLHQVVHAILAGDSGTAGRLLEQVQPDSPDNIAATLSSCIGIALGLLDDTLAPADAPTVALPAGRWNGSQAATDMLAVARKDKAFRSLDKLLIRRGGPRVLDGSALGLAATSPPSPAPPTSPPKTPPKPSSADHCYRPSHSTCCDGHWESAAAAVRFRPPSTEVMVSLAGASVAPLPATPDARRAVPRHL